MILHTHTHTHTHTHIYIYTIIYTCVYVIVFIIYSARHHVESYTNIVSFYPIPNTAIKISHFTDGKIEAKTGSLMCPRLTED